MKDFRPSRRWLTAAVAAIAIGLVQPARPEPVVPVPVAARVAVWDAVVAEQLGLALPLAEPKPYEVSRDGLEATFAKGASRWTIVGANAPIVSPVVRPAEWPVKGSGHQILVLPDPITNDAVLPFSAVLPSAIPGNLLSVTAAPGSMEAASFVIRSGDRALAGVTVRVGDLRRGGAGAKPATIPASEVDVRVVKCWYQAGGELNDTRHKALKAELLLHDDGLVAADHARQVVLIRDYDRIEDSTTLLPFDVPARENRQVWLTVKVRDGTPAGRYQGEVTMTVGDWVDRLALMVDVLPFSLPEPAMEYAIYYEGFLSDLAGARPGSWHKSSRQLLAELEDMRGHGLTNATIRHEVDTTTTDWSADWSRLRRTLELREAAGWGSKPLLYLDWKMRWSHDLPVYRRKLVDLLAQAASAGVPEVFVYGLDERRGDAFAALVPIYQSVHRAGAKTFVAMTEDTYLRHGVGLVDVPIFWGVPGVHMKNVAKLRDQGVRVWKYSNPQAGLEEPATYRREYGAKLFALGFAGACDYQYQRGSWNDFVDPNGRMNTMAYPTVSAPVPTIQWEGWRTAVDDVRYLTLLRQRGQEDPTWLGQVCVADPVRCRREAIVRLLQPTQAAKSPP